jgi:Mg-chelatase subunit ChlD
MQASADATALILAKSITGLSDAQVSQKADDYFKAQFSRPDAQNLVVTATYDRVASQVKVGATANVKTSFMGMMGFSSLPVGAESQVKWGGSKLQVALALDTTGSMAASGKMAAMKTATLNLLDILKAAALNPNDVNVAIVPFAKDVNIGKKNVNKPWIDWTAWNAANAGSGGTSGMSGSICYNGQLWNVNGSSFSYGGSCTGQSTGICYNGQVWNWNGSGFVVTGPCAGNVDHSSWNGCVTDRAQDHDILNTAPNASNPATMFVAEQYDACPAPVMGLTNKWTDLIGLVGLMTPAGNTNQQIGLAWAWMALSQGEPLNAPAKNSDTTQVIILLSDGMNTQNRFSSNQADIDARQARLCTNIKAAGIVIYAVQVNTGGDPVQNVMKNCASDASKFFMLTTADQIIATFSNIGTKISKLRISS